MNIQTGLDWTGSSKMDPSPAMVQATVPGGQTSNGERDFAQRNEAVSGWTVGRSPAIEPEHRRMGD